MAKGKLQLTPQQRDDSSANDDWIAQKTLLTKRKADYYSQRQISVSSESLQRAIEGPSFQLLSPSKQEALKAKYLEVLLNTAT